MQPIIGITAGLDHTGTDIHKTCLMDKYYQAIIASGGIPIILPFEIPIKEMISFLNHIDGIMITGGGDIETQRYNGENHPKVYGVEPLRDQFEIDLVLAAEKLKKPILGICRGIQVINVAMGGDLYSDIHDQVPGSIKHDWFPDFPRDQLSHKVDISRGSLLNSIIDQTSLEVNSLHHQAIKKLSPKLTASAYSPDGIIEAVEINNHPFFLGVQWHPEWLFNLQTTKELFNKFVVASRIQ